MQLLISVSCGSKVLSASTALACVLVHVFFPARLMACSSPDASSSPRCRNGRLNVLRLRTCLHHCSQSHSAVRLFSCSWCEFKTVNSWFLFCNADEDFKSIDRLTRAVTLHSLNICCKLHYLSWINDHVRLGSQEAGLGYLNICEYLHFKMGEYR